MLAATPDQRSRKILSNLNLALLGSFLILAAVLSIFLPMPIALFLSIFLSSYVELGIVACVRPFFRANAFLKKGYRDLLNYECSCALFSLPGIGFALILYPFSACGKYLSPSAGSTPIPEVCDFFVLAYFFSFLLGPLILLLVAVLGLVAIGLLIGKLVVFVSAAHKAEQGKIMNYPFSIVFFQ